jgi:hypothetical protein
MREILPLKKWGPSYSLVIAVYWPNRSGKTIRRLAQGHVETEKALLELCDTPGINTLADLARYQLAQAGRPSPTRRQLINFARDFRKTHNLVERAIESGVARDAGYSEEEIGIWRNSGKLTRRKVPPRQHWFYNPQDSSPHAKQNLGESIGKPDSPEVLLRSMLSAATTVHYHRIAAKIVYAHDLPQEPTPLPVVPFNAAEGYLRVLYSPTRKGPDEKHDELLQADHTVVLKPMPLEGVEPDPRIAMRPFIGVLLRPAKYNAAEYEDAALVGSISSLSGERRLHNLPHDDALEAANRDRIFIDDRYGQAMDLPARPAGLGRRGKFQRYSLPKGVEVPPELRFRYSAKGQSRPPRETEQESPWLPTPFPRQYVDRPRADAGEHTTHGLKLAFEEREHRRVYSLNWPRTVGLNFQLEDFWLTRLLLKVSIALGHKYKPFGWPSNIESFIATLPAGEYKLAGILNEALNQ